MAIHMSALPGILFRPTETLQKLKKEANLVDGLKLYLMVGVIAFIIAVIVNKTLIDRVMSYGSSLSTGSVFRQVVLMSDTMIVLSEIFNFVIGLVIFLVVVLLTCKLTASIAGKKSNFDKTAGLLSYVGAAFYLIIVLPLSLLSLIVTMILPLDAGPMPFFSNIGILLLAAVVVLLVVIWEWLIAGKAAATAIGGTWSSGIVGVFVAVIILILVLALIFILGVLAFATTSGLIRPGLG